MIAAFIFGAADAVADQLGVAGVNSNLALMTPYIITILALVLVGVRVRRSAHRPAPRHPDSGVSPAAGGRMSTKIVSSSRVGLRPRARRRDRPAPGGR